MFRLAFRVRRTVALTVVVALAAVIVPMATPTIDPVAADVCGGTICVDDQALRENVTELVGRLVPQVIALATKELNECTTGGCQQLAQAAIAAAMKLSGDVCSGSIDCANPSDELLTLVADLVALTASLAQLAIDAAVPLASRILQEPWVDVLADAVIPLAYALIDYASSTVGDPALINEVAIRLAGLAATVISLIPDGSDPNSLLSKAQDLEDFVLSRVPDAPDFPPLVNAVPVLDSPEEIHDYIAAGYATTAPDAYSYQLAKLAERAILARDDLGIPIDLEELSDAQVAAMWEHLGLRTAALEGPTDTAGTAGVTAIDYGGDTGLGDCYPLDFQSRSSSCPGAPDAWDSTNDEEKRTCVRNNYDCWRSRTAKTDAEKEVVRRWPGREYVDNRFDAFRHCYWSALMTKRANAEFAESMGDAHEGGDDNPQTQQARDMDLHNNEWGRHAGEETEGKSDRVTSDLCSQYVDIRLLTWIKNEPDDPR